MVKSQSNTEKAALAKQHQKLHMSKKNKKKEIVVPNFIVDDDDVAREQQVAVSSNDNKKKGKRNVKADALEEQPIATESLTRKEKRKQILTKRLDRKLTALEKLHEQNKFGDESALAAVVGKPRNIFADDDHDDDDDENDGGDENQRDEEDNEDDESDDATSSQECADAEVNGDNSDAGDAAVGTADDDGISEPPPSDSEAKPRKQHIKQVAAAAAAPRKASLGGTYWKERKEKKSRTIFVGGIPGNAGLGLVRRLLSQYGADGAIENPKQDIEVDFIQPKSFEAAKFRSDRNNNSHHIPKNAYCVLPTKEMAKRVASALDGVWVHPEEAVPITDRDANTWRQNHPESNAKPSKLRVNSADDKGQRDIAISKRKGGDGNKDAYYRKNRPGGQRPGATGGGFKKFVKKA